MCSIPLRVSLMILLVLHCAGSARAQDGNSQACVDALGYVACSNMGKPNTPAQTIRMQWERGSC